MNHLSELDRQAFGLSTAKLQAYRELNAHGEKEFFLHKEALRNFLAFKELLAKQGFNLSLVSAYRGFERQLAIFSAKAKGKRPLLDSQGKRLCFDELSEQDLLEAILRWSALPGLSRHHFGTDIDVYDANAMPLSEVELIPSEVEHGGPCADMHKAIDKLIESNQSFGFFRPYSEDCGGISVERWHLSYAPIAKNYQALLSKSKAMSLWQEFELPLFDQVSANIDEIFLRFVEIHPNNLPDWMS